jgi:hypothetical protein
MRNGFFRGHARRAAAVAVLALAGCASTARQPNDLAIAPFATDGCTMFPDRAPDGGADWCSCCVAHDLAYWRGGSAGERRQADAVFEACVRRSANSGLLAALMFAAVRISGGPYFNTSFRWGYGWPYYRPYGALTAEEAAAADALEHDYLSQHPASPCPSAAQRCAWKE